MKTENLSRTSWFTKQWQSLIWPRNYLPEVGLESPMSENYEREKGPYYLQFQKLYDSTWVVTTDFYSINLVKREANKTPADTIFIYDSFYEASCRENLNDIKYPVLFVQDCCDLISQHFVKVSFRVVDVLEAPKKALTWHYAFIFHIVNYRVSVFKNSFCHMPILLNHCPHFWKAVISLKFYWLTQIRPIRETMFWL